jgi:hypothetical protein
MKDPKKIHTCLWAYRFELLGLILLVIATLLTIFTFNSVGIAAMFLVALVLCAHGCLCNKCSKVCQSEETEKSKTTTKKPPTKK